MKVYILHEVGAVPHYRGLAYLCATYKAKPIYRELNIVGQFIDCIRYKSFRPLCKAVINVFFLFSLLIGKKKKIVLGLAPYNYILWILYPMLLRHEVYYHTSYTCWDQSRMARGKFYSSKLLKLWRWFLSFKVKHIFAVTQLTKDELVNNGFSSRERISVVYHSYETLPVVDENKVKESTYVVVGNLIPKKGVHEILEYFKNHPETQVSFVGKGALEGTVKDAAKTYDNISYVGYIKDFNKLALLYKDNCFLILNSKRMLPWEELFGMVVVEAMSFGCVPVCSKHPGPSEVISDGIDGFLFEESEFYNMMDKLNNVSSEEYSIIRRNSVSTGREYHCSTISERWKPIFYNL